MNSLEFSILSTLALYAAEGRSALAQNEIYAYLSKPPEDKRAQKPAEKEFIDCLSELQKDGRVFKHEDYYSLENRPGIAEENAKKARRSADKIKGNKWPLWFLRFTPFTRAIAVTGSVALQNARPTSDLDLLIIVQRGRIWTARIIALLVLEIFGRRREKSKEKICLNFFAAESSVYPIQNTASANMLRRAIPLYGINNYHKWLARNKWTDDFIYPSSPRIGLAYATEAKPMHGIFERLLGGKMGGWLEQFFKNWQYQRLTRKITAPDHLENLVLTDDILMLHYPNPKNAKIMSLFRSLFPNKMFDF